MDIRPMSIDDYDNVFDLWQSTAGVGLRSLDDSKPGIEKFLKRNAGMSFVALTNGSIAGAILCGHDGRRGYLYHLAVREACQRKGIGTLLVHAALHALKREGIHKAALVVFHTNEPGNAFWKSLGFGKRDDLFYRNISLNENNI